ncbi:YciI family protein [Chitinophaga defluvii]|uniref:YciI family protein n=1 Tax=Chitinophaga defluvii TaxID=3163343 RepID=A0ABV2TAQ7_9BACT
MKEFLMLIRENADYGTMTPQEMQEDIERHIQWVEALVNSGHFSSSNPLMQEGTVIKGKDKIVTDGPFVESKECISGYYFLRATSLAAATEIAKGCPALMAGATLEIREIMPVDDAPGQ